MSIIKRTAEILKILEVQEVSKKTGLKDSTLYRIRNGNNYNIDVLEVILKMYPQINPLWVFTGKGEMFFDFNKIKDSNIMEVSEPETIYGNQRLGVLEQMQHDIKNLQKEISNLKIIISQLKT